MRDEEGQIALREIKVSFKFIQIQVVGETLDTVYSLGYNADKSTYQLQRKDED